MQEAIDHLDIHTTVVEGTKMVPLTEAYKALELSMKSQLEAAIQTIEETFTELESTIISLENER